jgi:hypothetical protein
MRAYGEGLRTLLASTACALSCGLGALGCGGGVTLGVDPTEPKPVESLPAPPLGERAYRKILLLPPADAVGLRDVEFDVPREKKASYYVGKLEKLLLAQGFEVISSEIVARADDSSAAAKLSPAEKAMVLGRQTKADAVLMLQSRTRPLLRRGRGADDRGRGEPRARGRRRVLRQEQRPLREPAALLRGPGGGEVARRAIGRGAVGGIGARQLD